MDTLDWLRVTGWVGFVLWVWTTWSTLKYIARTWDGYPITQAAIICCSLLMLGSLMMAISAQMSHGIQNHSFFNLLNIFGARIGVGSVAVVVWWMGYRIWSDGDPKISELLKGGTDAE